MSLDRYYAWRKRLHSSVAGLPLSFGVELWGDLRGHPAYGRVAKLSNETNDSTIRHLLTEMLLDDVAHAAGGIEYTVEKIKVALQSAQTKLGEFAANDPTFLRGPEPERGRRFCDVPIDHAHFEFMNLLAWAIALEERLDRSGTRVHPVRRGIVPSLAPETTLTPRVRDAVSALRQAIDGTRYLANYAAHASAIPHPGASAKIIDARIVLPVPDPPTEPVEISAEFTYEQGRDLESFADELLAAVEVFMDALLSAFEDAARVGRTEPDKFFVGELPSWAKKVPPRDPEIV